MEIDCDKISVSFSVLQGYCVVQNLHFVMIFASYKLPFLRLGFTCSTAADKLRFLLSDSQCFIAGSLILISVFLFAKDVGWEALATKPYTDTGVLLASNWRTQKQWERWPIALFISLAQTLKCNRFWRYTSVISAEVNISWTELQGKGSPPTYTLDKFRARKCIFCTVFPCQICMGLSKIYSYALLTKREVKMAGYWPRSFFFFCFFFFLRLYGLRRSLGP